MIPKYRNKGAIRLGIGFGLLLLGTIFAVLTAHSNARPLGGFIGVVSGIIGYLIFVFGCADLLKAKGYDSSMGLAFVIPALCCGLGFIFIAPLIIVFGLKDKKKRH